ncbi:MAG: hypothetical protein KA171_24115, partial [Reyranella sp.]|nr:hypothetical protein [Reyranella sp.]
MAEADRQRALQRVGGEKGGRRRETLGQQQDVEPAVERRAVAPGDDGGAVLGLSLLNIPVPPRRYANSYA